MPETVVYIKTVDYPLYSPVTWCVSVVVVLIKYMFVRRS